MKKTLVTLLLCLATFAAGAQASASGERSKETPAAAQQEDDSSAAQDLGRTIGVWLKRGTEVLKDVFKGISEGFGSEAGSPADGAECTDEQARAGKCKPGPGEKQSAPAQGQQESASLLVRLFKALF